MLTNPCEPTQVVGFDSHRLGFGEDPVGVLQRPAEHFDEASLTQRRRQLRIGAERAEQVDALGELITGTGEVAVLLCDDSDQPARDRFLTDVSGEQCRFEHLLRVDLGERRIATFDPGASPRQLQGTFGVLRRGTKPADRARGWSGGSPG